MAGYGQVRLRLDLGKLNAQVGFISREAVRKGATAAERRVRANIITDDLVNTGGMLNSVQQKDLPGPMLFPRTAIGPAATVAKFPEYGTRGHGPVRAKALRFQPKGSQRIVFAKWVRGVRAYQFMRRSLDAMRPTDFE